ncbi:PDZ domain-containing protein [Thiomicrorhabdus sp.]|uniref:M61 family metallopeptidase n=1 Tax=Thiomicrorhabdus sp. TaxID=2039724 RepID=UPI0029C69B3A|nr:PDZ domain-containing protein [Thiomicrorhabdus sp.]
MTFDTIHYELELLDPHAHLFEVKLTIAHPEQPSQTVSLPNWIPGSYLIRDFSKHLIDLQAFDAQGNSVDLTALDKSSWKFSCDRATTLTYQVYAWDLSVRGAYFDDQRAFFNGTSVFLQTEGQSDLPHTLHLKTNRFTREKCWCAASGMPQINVDASGFGKYQTENYAALIDYPFEIGTHQTLDFEACNIPHKMVISGIFECDFERLKQDLIKICETEINLFGSAPMDSYLFQLFVTGNDYGGLEHRNSTALICSRDDLPYIGMQEASDGYVRLLELCSHEYFHSWNVKSIQPQAFQNADLQQPQYTHQLWWFEGVTSYYDALILLRANVINEARYLQLLGEQMTRVYRMPGRFRQSVADSSWFTWTKFYQQDENAPNAIISYYTKGSLIALALDLFLRQHSNGDFTLDDILRHLWEQYGRNGISLQEKQIESLCSELSGYDFQSFFDQYLYDTKDLPFEEILREFGYRFERRPYQGLNDLGGTSGTSLLKMSLGMNVKAEVQGLRVTHVWNDSAAHKAGLSAGDLLIALDKLKIDSIAQLEQKLQRARNGVQWHCHYFRRDELREALLLPEASVSDRVVISRMNAQEMSEKGSLSWI